MSQKLYSRQAELGNLDPMDMNYYGKVEVFLWDNLRKPTQFKLVSETPLCQLVSEDL